MKKKVVVLGGGISGLSAAWYLSRTGLPLEITILEKSSRPGGCMHTDHTMGFHFEKGPRAFRVDRCPDTLQLARDLGVQEEMVWTESKLLPRYLWHEGEFYRFPMNPLSFLFSPITKGLVSALLTEFRKPSKSGDETVWEFALRRFNYDVARLLFDPIVVGIFGGDIRKISIRACFPQLKNWEEKHGSLTRGWFSHRREKKNSVQDYSGIPGSAFLSFRSGIEELPQSLARQIPATFHYNTNVVELFFDEQQIVVKTEGERFIADFLFCALPALEAGRLFEQHVPEISKDLLKIPCASIDVVNLGYDADVLKLKGFGYLAPVQSHEEILGVVFDSIVFPGHNRNQQETRLTVKMAETGCSEEKTIEAALKGIRRHLGISQMPKAISFKRPSRAIPQYGVGHLEKMADLTKAFCQELPQCRLIGNYLEGISVNQCISFAKKTVVEWRSSQDIFKAQ